MLRASQTPKNQQSPDQFLTHFGQFQQRVCFGHWDEVSLTLKQVRQTPLYSQFTTFLTTFFETNFETAFYSLFHCRNKNTVKAILDILEKQLTRPLFWSFVESGLQFQLSAYLNYMEPNDKFHLIGLHQYAVLQYLSQTNNPAMTQFWLKSSDELGLLLTLIKFLATQPSHSNSNAEKKQLLLFILKNAPVTVLLTIGFVELGIFNAIVKLRDVHLIGALLNNLHPSDAQELIQRNEFELVQIASISKNKELEKFLSIKIAQFWPWLTTEKVLMGDYSPPASNKEILAIDYDDETEFEALTKEIKSACNISSDNPGNQQPSFQKPLSANAPDFFPRRLAAATNHRASTATRSYNPG